MKNIIKKYIFIMLLFINVIFISDVFASERLVCNYSGDTSTGKISYKLEFELKEYDEKLVSAEECIVVNKVNECISQCEVTNTKKYCSSFCSNSCNDIKVEEEFDLKEGSKCPKEFKATSLQNFERENLSKVSCGSGPGSFSDIPKKIPELTSYIITVLYVAIPVLLVIMGSIDLFKGIMSQKDDEMKKGQQMFIKRLIVAVLIFFIVVIMKFLISVIADTNQANIVDCIDCFISNECKTIVEKS